MTKRFSSVPGTGTAARHEAALDPGLLAAARVLGSRRQGTSIARRYFRFRRSQ